MKRLSSKNLRWIRNFIMIAEMILIFFLWLQIPPIIENDSLVHVGNGKYGSRLGFLLMVLFPLLGLIPNNGLEKWEDAEIHTNDAKEREKIEEERKTKAFIYQILLSVFGFIIACFGVILAAFGG